MEIASKKSRMEFEVSAGTIASMILLLIIAALLTLHGTPVVNIGSQTSGPAMNVATGSTTVTEQYVVPVRTTKEDEEGVAKILEHGEEFEVELSYSGMEKVDAVVSFSGNERTVSLETMETETGTIAGTNLNMEPRLYPGTSTEYEVIEIIIR